MPLVSQIISGGWGNLGIFEFHFFTWSYSSPGYSEDWLFAIGCRSRRRAFTCKLPPPIEPHDPPEPFSVSKMPMENEGSGLSSNFISLAVLLWVCLCICVSRVIQRCLDRDWGNTILALSPAEFYRSVVSMRTERIYMDENYPVEKWVYTMQTFPTLCYLGKGIKYDPGALKQIKNTYVIIYGISVEKMPYIEIKIILMQL